MKDVVVATLTTPDGERRLLVRPPTAPTGTSLRPAVMLLHGAGGTAELALANTGWREAADREGFVLALPEGTRRDPAAPPSFLRNPQAWNDGSGRGHTARAGTDDVGFIGAALDALVRRHGVDPARIYLSGFSNGAAMVFRAAAALPDRVAAIGPVAGHCWTTPAPLPRPVPALMLFGGRDLLNPPEGGDVKTPWGHAEYHPPVLQSFDRWRSASVCRGQPVVRTNEHGDQDHAATGCAPGADVRCLIIADLGHHWPGAPRLLPSWIAGPASRRIRGAEILWEFFRRHRIA
ncbi:MAG TPA: PHB depolymerase family esterase [Gemmatimonadales bacterium]|nr:PHB depolymerase family esterase [Gemmatimonadales bacterium]